jgi:hypothetical protein
MDCKTCERRKGSSACDECGWWRNYRRVQDTKELGTIIQQASAPAQSDPTKVYK